MGVPSRMMAMRPPAIPAPTAEMTNDVTL
jgi:hypothetical protein